MLSELEKRWASILKKQDTQDLVRISIREDTKDDLGDITSEAIFCDVSQKSQAHIVVKEDIVVCGLPLAEFIFKNYSSLKVKKHIKEGSYVKKHTPIMAIQGPIKHILMFERVVLNFLMRLCGVASITKKAVDSLPQDSHTKIFDTRKTMPGFRLLDKIAVFAGGGYNHRYGLSDFVLIKDNHIALAESIFNAVKLAQKYIEEDIKRPKTPIQVEVDTLEQLGEAILAKPDIILLDNFPIEKLCVAVQKVKGKILLEASGGVTLNTIHQIASTGVDRISIGSITHSAPAVDISLDIL